MGNDLLERAITRLERLKADSTPGPWTMYASGWSGKGIDTLGNQETHEPVIMAQDEQGGESWSNDNDAELIVTLHRTLDAQLSMLKWAMIDIRFRYNRDIIALAKAILGE